MENNNIDFSWLENMDIKGLHKTLKLLNSFREDPNSINQYINKTIELLNDKDVDIDNDDLQKLNSVKEDINNVVNDNWHNRGDVNFFEDGFLIKHLHDDVYDVITCDRMWDESQNKYVYFYRSGIVNSDITDDNMISEIANFAGEDVSTYKDNIYLYIEDLVRYLGLQDLDPYCKVFNDLTMDEVKTLLEEDDVKISKYDEEKEVLEITR